MKKGVIISVSLIAVLVLVVVLSSGFVSAAQTSDCAKSLTIIQKIWYGFVGIFGVKAPCEVALMPGGCADLPTPSCPDGYHSECQNTNPGDEANPDYNYACVQDNVVPPPPPDGGGQYGISCVPNVAYPIWYSEGPCTTLEGNPGTIQYTIRAEVKCYYVDGYGQVVELAWTVPEERTDFGCMETPTTPPTGCSSPQIECKNPDGTTYCAEVCVSPGYCGDGICQSSENSVSCAQDCPSTGGGCSCQEGYTLTDTPCDPNDPTMDCTSASCSID